MNPNTQYMAGVLAGAIVVGIICGLFPLKIAAAKNRPLLGLLFFVVCVGMGLVGGLLFGVPTSIVLCAIVKMLPDKHIRQQVNYEPNPKSFRDSFRMALPASIDVRNNNAIIPTPQGAQGPAGEAIRQRSH
jgi:hypothetical protein